MGENLMDFEKLKKLLESYGKEKDIDEYIKVYEDHLSRNKKYLNLRFEGEAGDWRRIKGIGLALRQMLHHRAVSLYEGSLLSSMQNNVYLVALSVRGHYETTAAMGYFCARLHSYSEGNIGAETIEEEIGNQIRGSRAEELLLAPDPKNILTQLDYADKAIGRLLINDGQKDLKWLRESYEFLCEFCHPNFHSNKLSYNLDEKNGVFIFRYEGEQILKKEFGIIEYILISGGLFIDLFDWAGEFLKQPKR